MVEGLVCAFSGRIFGSPVTLEGGCHVVRFSAVVRTCQHRITRYPMGRKKNGGCGTYEPLPSKKIVSSCKTSDWINDAVMPVCRRTKKVH